MLEGFFSTVILKMLEPDEGGISQHDIIWALCTQLVIYTEKVTTNPTHMRRSREHCNSLLRLLYFPFLNFDSGDRRCR